MLLGVHFGDLRIGSLLYADDAVLLASPVPHWTKAKLLKVERGGDPQGLVHE